MSPIEFQITDQPLAEDAAFVFRQLIGFNETRTGDASARELAVFARQGTGIVGGLTGFTHWNWLHVRFLWVAETLRGRGVGSHLVRAAEEEARARGCAHVHLDTFSFQAVPFYERLGYSVFGRLDDYPPGHSRVFYQKRLLPT